MGSNPTKPRGPGQPAGGLESWHNSIPRLQAKAGLLLEQELGGVMIGSLDDDVKGWKSLLGAIHEVLNPPVSGTGRQAHRAGELQLKGGLGKREYAGHVARRVSHVSRLSGLSVRRGVRSRASGPVDGRSIDHGADPLVGAGNLRADRRPVGERAGGIRLWRRR